MPTEFVTLKDLAQEMRLDRSNLRKYVIDAGITFVKIRTPESRGQLTLALTPANADEVRDLRDREGYLKIRAVAGDNGDGWFYIIQLVPDLKPQRIKLGFTSNVGSRLSAHRTAAPTAKVIETWSCRKVWEVAAIDSVTREGCASLSGEVFDCDSLDSLIDRAQGFFDQMPNQSQSGTSQLALW